MDIAVIEVGLGGRLDSTNILPPFQQPSDPAQPSFGVMLSVITNIGFDHTEFLGDTLPKIAAEKAGIIKPDIPCVIGETDEQTAPVFLDAAKRNHILGDGLETDRCRIFFADRCEYLRRERLRIAPECQLKGDYQDHNLQTAFVALRAVWNTLMQSSFPSFSRSVQTGFAQVCTLTGLRGRWEVLNTRPLTICDTGHNSHGLRYVSTQLQQILRERLSTHADSVLRMVFGMVDDKDVDKVAELMPGQAVYYLTQPATHRAIPADRMLSIWQTALPHTQATAYPRLADALAAAKKDCRQQDILFIGGSNYLVGQVLTN